MKILVFTEGTILIPKSAEGLSREEIVEKSRQEGIQREEASIQYESKNDVPVKPNSVHDYANYAPKGNVTSKLNQWKSQGATIYYLSSRRVRSEVDAIRNVLKNYNLPDSENLLFRSQGEDYKDVAEHLIPDILIEDDCESIGGKNEMTYPHIKPELKSQIKSVVIKEFTGIDHPPDDITQLS